MKYLTKQRILWSSVALGLLWFGKYVLYDEFVRCEHRMEQMKIENTNINTNQYFRTTSPIMVTKMITDEKNLQTISPTLTSPTFVSPIHNLLEFVDEQLKLSNQLFEPTVRSCLGPKCFDMPANGVDRIGLLAPPGSGVEILENILNKVVPSLITDKLAIISGSNVPAYGYGKNHGWSRILRLVRSPISQAYQLLNEAQTFQSMGAGPILDSQVRQLVRWHCRLSHVAAHTRMLTVFIEDLRRRPVFHLEQIITFLGIPLPDRARLRTLADDLQRDYSSQMKFENISDFFTLKTDLTTTLHPESKVRSMFDQAIVSLREEIVGTKGLTMWPCRSFRSLSPPPVVPFQLLVPNCSSSWVTCSVDFDRQEVGS